MRVIACNDGDEMVIDQVRIRTFELDAYLKAFSFSFKRRPFLHRKLVRLKREIPDVDTSSTRTCACHLVEINMSSF